MEPAVHLVGGENDSFENECSPKAAIFYQALPVSKPNKNMCQIDSRCDEVVSQWSKPRVAKKVLQEIGGMGGMGLRNIQIRFAAALLCKAFECSRHPDKREMRVPMEMHLLGRPPWDKLSLPKHARPKVTYISEITSRLYSGSGRVTVFRMEIGGLIPRTNNYTIYSVQEGFKT
ncbi:hypothetical protein NDU88_011285 [Pleurodeles waltl]|uniref:Uncharacterized protein n=1 Tax=Pleurodeles waltl TaxID=8319 RepID=A0AAV7R2L8_PLEWA|nr:hypothetical protein NDU88_011285 [Pleurodeles waltl]